MKLYSFSRESGIRYSKIISLGYGYHTSLPEKYSEVWLKVLGIKLFRVSKRKWKSHDLMEKIGKEFEDMKTAWMDAEYFPPSTRQKGWVSIEEYLPMMHAVDSMQGYTLYKVKDKDGNEFESAVSDHNVWYYMAKEAGITHWLNGE